MTKNPEGFPAGSVRTAGGYTVVPEGKSSAWSIYAPGQKASDTPHTRVWGDPHVKEKDGTRWDFTKDSKFKLPDGTMIAVDTSAQTGASYTDSLTIQNGDDMVSIDGIRENKPVTSSVRSGGFTWRNQSAQADQPTFVLGGTHDDVRWHVENDGRIGGEITGARMQNGSYAQTVNDERFYVASDLKPEFGPAYGNMLRNNLIDQNANRSDLSPSRRRYLAAMIQGDHRLEIAGLNPSTQSWLQGPLGGVGSYFGSGGYPGAFSAYSALPAYFTALQNQHNSVRMNQAFFMRA